MSIATESRGSRNGANRSGGGLSGKSRYGAARLGSELKAVRAFIGLHWDYTIRYLAWDMVWLVYHLISAMIVGYIGLSSGASPAFLAPGQFVAYLLIGAVMWSYLSVIFYIVADTIALERWEGTLEYTFMAPIHRLTHLTGVALVGIIYSIVRTVAMVLILWVMFRLDLSSANWLSCALALAVGSLAMVGIALCAAVMPLLSPEKGSMANHILSAVLLLASGVYYEITVLPQWLQWLAQINPAYWMLEATRAALLDGASPGQIAGDLAALALTGALYIPLGFAIFRAGERFAKRTGLLKRSG